MPLQRTAYFTPARSLSPQAIFAAIRRPIYYLIAISAFRLADEDLVRLPRRLSAPLHFLAFCKSLKAHRVLPNGHWRRRLSPPPLLSMMATKYFGIFDFQL